ncbi:hypothetical protein LEP1GSC165_0065 [Leptospira santarosai str. CBC523]|nr:hypothetical protein LEP1GSC165_0065 [Leptospira santarosai str. CBC523]
MLVTVMAKYKHIEIDQLRMYPLNLKNYSEKNIRFIILGM